jgi:hypothetical protein
MTISSETRKAGPYTGNGIATSFPFTFKVFAEADILVISANLLEVESTLLLGTDYTVSLNPNQDISPGGSVELLSALATDYKLVLTSAVDVLQPVDLTNQGGFYPTVINNALDRLTIICQQLNEQVGRSVKVQISETRTPEELATALLSAEEIATAAAAAAAASAASVDLGALDQAVVDAEAAAQIATDAVLFNFENPVLNGDMRVAQSGVSFSCSTGSTKVIDGWLFGMAGSAVVTVSQQPASTPDNANAKWLIGTVATADAAIASGDFGFLHQRIEGFDIAEYVGQTFTVGAWVKSSVTGVHSICLRNSGFDRYYVGQVNILAANTPQFATLTITGGLPVSGTWDFSSGAGLELGFVLASGSGFHGTVGSWQTGANIASAAQVNALGTIGNVFGITDVQINPGTTAKKFKRPTYQASLSRCQRYYEPLSLQVGEDTSSSTKGNGHSWKVEKRVTPILTVANGTGSNSAATVSFTVPGGDSKTGIYQSSGTNIGTVGAFGNKIVTGDARL